MEYIAQGGDSLPYLATLFGTSSIPFQLENCNKKLQHFISSADHTVPQLVFPSNDFHKTIWNSVKVRNKKANKGDKNREMIAWFPASGSFSLWHITVQCFTA